jgi:outer membrane protein
MKKSSLILQSILVLAVAVLYFLHFKHQTDCGIKKSTPKAKAVSNGAAPGVQIAYIDLDSLNEKIDYIKTTRKTLEVEQNGIENEWENAYKGLENEKNKFLNKSSVITREEAEAFQASLMQKQQMVDAVKQDKLQKLNEKSFKFLEEIQQNLKAFLNEYNEEGRYSFILSTGNGLDYMLYKDSASNISEDVIAGMNERFKQEKK